MAKSKRVTYFKTKVEDKPGALLALTKDLKAKNLMLTGLKGFGQTGAGEVLVIAKNPEKLRNTWKNASILVEEGTAFFISGTDKTGALIPGLEAIANAGINITAIDAIAVGGRFGSLLFVAPADVDKTVQALGVK
jgi:prephenate dehydratase